jgi:Flp pilus assembly protein TadD
MGGTPGSGRRGFGGLFARSLPVAFVLAALAGCEPFPAHIDPVSTNGRDGAGVTPSYDALLRIGTAARSGGDLSTALAVFRRAASIAPTATAPFIAIGDTLLAMRQVNDAVVAYNSALARDGSDVAAELGLARAFLESGRPELALAPVSKAAALRPNDPRVWLLLGVAKDQAGEHPAAQQAYRRGLSLAPGDPALSVDLALSLALSGNYPAAVAVLGPIALAPKASAQERQSLALIYGLDGRTAEAARLGRIDLDEAAVEHNLAYYQTLRELSPEARSHAILSAGRTPAPGGLS